MTEPFTQDDLSFLDAALAASVNPIPPPSSTRARILAAVRDIPYDSRTLRVDEGAWVPFRVPGVTAKVLCSDDQRNTTTFLLKIPPGTRMGAHDHHGSEECYVVSGAVSLGGVHVAAGDFHRAAAGSHHGELYTQNGCTLLLVLDHADFA